MKNLANSSSASSAKPIDPSASLNDPLSIRKSYIPYMGIFNQVIIGLAKHISATTKLYTDLLTSPLALRGYTVLLSLPLRETKQSVLYDEVYFILDSVIGSGMNR